MRRNMSFLPNGSIPNRRGCGPDWIRTGSSFRSGKLGDKVQKGELLGHVVDPLTDIEHETLAPRSGTLIGMAVSRPVLNGYGLFHIAWTE